jgi:hypothetical protein
VAIPSTRHCEARSAVAIQAAVQLPDMPKQTARQSGLPRACGPRNDGVTRLAAPSPAPAGAPSPPKYWGRGDGKRPYCAGNVTGLILLFNSTP